MYITGALDTFEWKTFDYYSRILNPKGPATDQYVIIEIDQKSIDAASSQFVYWPWPRQTYADVVNYLAEAEAVFIDLLFLEDSSYGVEDDMRFAKAIRAAGNVYLPLRLTNENKSVAMSSLDYWFIKTHVAYPDVEQIILPPIFRSADLPIAVLRESLAGAGNATVRPDQDGVFRRVPLVASFERFVIPFFSTADCARSKALTIKNGQLSFLGNEVPLFEGSALLRFYKNPHPFSTFSIIDIFNAIHDERTGKHSTLSRSFFRGKTVFIGPTAGGLYDLKPTPVAPISSGLLMNATVHCNLTSQGFFKPVSRVITAGLLVLLSVLTLWIILRTTSFALNVISYCLLVAGAFSLAGVTFASGWYLSIIYGPATITLTFLIGSLYSYATEDKQKREIKQTFARYMDKTLVEYILKNPHLLHPGGNRYEVTVFFADMAGFTTLSEQIQPHALALILHRVHTVLTGEIIRHGGVIDKYIGDAVMAFWGAPLQRSDDRAQACRAALACKKAIEMLNKELIVEGLPPITMRIGIHTGDAIVGNMGSDQIFDFTVIGDTVNLASRLESANKYFGTSILVSEATLSGAGSEFLSREIGMIAVKGKSIPIRIFELIGLHAEISEDIMRQCAAYQTAFDLLKEKRYGDAAQCFRDITEQFPHDGAARFHHDRCRLLVQNEAELTDDPLHITMTDK
jgi:adenylate cyclase